MKKCIGGRGGARAVEDAETRAVPTHRGAGINPGTSIDAARCVPKTPDKAIRCPAVLVSNEIDEQRQHIVKPQLYGWLRP